MEQDLPTPNYGGQNTSFKNHLVEFIETLAIFLAVALFIYYLIAQPHKVSGSSMFPNFKNNDYIITNKITYRFQNPERGQVIVFKNPKDLTQDFIKRIIGLPGEKVKVMGGHVYLNGSLLQENYLSSDVYTTGGLFLPEGAEVTVPADNYFVMGDNRTASSDSREWGFVPKGDIIGEAFFRYWPENSLGLIQQGHY